MRPRLPSLNPVALAETAVLLSLSLLAPFCLSASTASLGWENCSDSFPSSLR
jgi:hypothetical protein